ncbi:hypothetical protein [Scatolibacter rhodanostii]|uniref:hypothetical protein n=1 Tax=Scatolibacter rhodanostii TaxID=2014781 RepID=UPI000C07088F|nr:hypothetical protein [Scatolibacter rhodanostii]
MKKFKQENLGAAFLLLVPFVILMLLSQTVFKDLYFFEWTADHYYSYLWVAVFWLTAIGKLKFSIPLSAGNFVGVFAGQFLGDYIRNKNMAKITEAMTAEQQYQLQSHPGFQIWMNTLVIFLVSGLAISIYLGRKKQKKRKDSAL